MKCLTRPRPRARWVSAGLGLLLAAAAAQAQLVVPAGATIVQPGITDLACTDALIDGTLDLAGGQLINVRHVVIGGGGAILLGSGSITLAGNWSNSGTLNAGTGSVAFVDDAACAGSSLISGNTSFNNLSITSASGKLYQFSAGSVQTVAGALTLSRVAGTPLRIESTTPGSLSADINLLAGGSQSLANLAVRGMSASGQWLAAGQTNQGPGPVSRWFGTPTPPGGIAPVPTLSQWALVGLALTLGALTARQRRPLKNKSTGRKS